MVFICRKLEPDPNMGGGIIMTLEQTSPGSFSFEDNGSNPHLTGDNLLLRGEAKGLERIKVGTIVEILEQAPAETLT